MNAPINRQDSSHGELDHPSLETILGRISRCMALISLGFERWDDAHARGPGLYFVLESTSVSAFTEPMGVNRWPVEECESVFTAPDVLLQTARRVASSWDGAVVIHDDGTFAEEMVRVTQLSTIDRDLKDDLPFAGWMGARHMSALETSTRPEVFATITLSEEDGRLTVFQNGIYEDSQRETLQAETISLTEKPSQWE